MSCRYILGMRVDRTSYTDTSDTVLVWTRRAESRYVCVATVHMVMESYDNSSFRRIVNDADLVTPDGMPLVWGLRLQGIRGQQRVYGPELTPRLLAQAEKQGLVVGFYGGAPDTLKSLLSVVERWFPRLKVGYVYSPPFRTLSPEEDDAVVQEINGSGTSILFVGLGCPKQERWMAEHKGRINAVMLGVGAAFDFLAGDKPQAPVWVQNSGLEWLFRLICEPRRLWRRYLIQNPRFLALFAMQLLRIRQFE